MVCGVGPHALRPSVDALPIFGPSCLRYPRNILTHRLVQDGLIQRLLLDRCQRRHYILCPYANQVKPQCLWWQGGQFEKSGGFAIPSEETWRVVLDSIRYHPARNMVAALGAFGLLVVALELPVPRDLVHELLQEFRQSRFSDFLRSRVSGRRGQSASHERIHNDNVSMPVSLSSLLHIGS